MQTYYAFLLGLPAIPQAIKMVEVFLKTEFEGGRHQRRVDKISACL